MIKQELKELMKQEAPRYDNFMIFDNPVNFREHWKNKEIDAVQIHQVLSLSKPPRKFITLVGSFEWKNNCVKSLDGDTYTADMDVLAYEDFTYKNDEGKECIGLDIIVKNW